MKEFPNPLYRGNIDFRLSVGGGDIVQITIEVNNQIFSETLRFVPTAPKSEIFKKTSEVFKEWSIL